MKAEILFLLQLSLCWCWLKLPSRWRQLRYNVFNDKISIQNQSSCVTIRGITIVQSYLANSHISTIKKFTTIQDAVTVIKEYESDWINYMTHHDVLVNKKILYSVSRWYEWQVIFYITGILWYYLQYSMALVDIFYFNRQMVFLWNVFPSHHHTPLSTWALIVTPKFISILYHFSCARAFQMYILQCLYCTQFLSFFV